MGTWGDIIAAADSKRFIGREIELLRFKEHLTLTPPEYLIHYIYGQGGVGKTTLLKEFQKSAMHEGWTVASCDERHQDVPKLLAHWADQLHQKGSTFHHFMPIYRTYQQRLAEIEQDPDAPQGFVEGFGRFLARETLRIGEHVPIIGEGVRLLPSESLEKHAGAWFGYLAKKITNKDEVAILRDPIGTLAPLFFKDLNSNAQETLTLLCIDTFEALPSHIESWLGQLAVYEPHQSIRLIIAGRTTPSQAWEPLRHLMWIVGLDVFTEEEAAIYLDQHGILDIDQRTEIVQLSGRLPVVMSLLAATDPKQASRSTTPITDSVDRFLRWIDDSTQRTAALLASTSKVFNIDILNVLITRDDSTFHPQAIFTWLCTMPFVQESDQGWHYHPVVRRLMLRYQRQMSLQGYRQSHAKLADWYNQQRSTIRHQPWANDAWQQATLHYVYHAVLTNPHTHWSILLRTIVQALWYAPKFVVTLLTTFLVDDVLDELSSEQISLLLLMQPAVVLTADHGLFLDCRALQILGHDPQLDAETRQLCWEALGTYEFHHGRFDAAYDLFSHSLAINPQQQRTLMERAMASLSLQRPDDAITDISEAITLKGPLIPLMLNVRGKIYQELQLFPEAIADFTQALKLDASQIEVRRNRSQVYLEVGSYPKALEDVNSVLQRGPKDIAALNQRGVIYYHMRRYTDALKDFNDVLTLESRYVPALTNRGVIYSETEHYEQALADFNHALEIEPDNLQLLVNRSVAYGEMNRCEEALEQLSTVFARDSKHIGAYAARGVIYGRMERYIEALNDFDQVLTANPDDIKSRLNRAKTYRELGRYEESLSDIKRVLDVDPTHLDAHIHRGITYREMEYYHEALADFNWVYAADPNDLESLHHRAVTYAALKQNDQALRDFNAYLSADASDVQAHINRGVVYHDMRLYEQALVDFDWALSVQPTHVVIRSLRGTIYKLLKRYEDAVVELAYAAELGSFNAKNDLGLVLNQLGRYTEAEALFYAAYQHDPEDITTLYNLIVTRFHIHGQQPIQPLIEQLQRLLPHAEVFVKHYGFGGLAALQNDSAQAIEHLTIALADDSTVIDWFHHDSAWNGIRADPGFKNLVNRYSS